jgi:hypothetical protein
VSLANATLGPKRLSAGSGVVAGNTRSVEFDTNTVNIDMGMWHDMEAEVNDTATA